MSGNLIGWKNSQKGVLYIFVFFATFLQLLGVVHFSSSSSSSP